MARISPKTTWKLAKAIKGRRKAEVTKSGSAMVSKIDGSGTVWIRPLGAASDVPVNGSSIASVKVGDTVTYETGDGRLKVTGNSTDPAVGAGGATAVANAAAEAATKVLTARIGNLEATSITADSAVIRELEADTAKVHDLTADQLSAATGYVGELTAGNVTAQNIIADKAKLAQVDVQQIDADHATIGTLDTTYMHANMSNSDVAWISNGVIANGAITNAMINGVSANKLTAGTINGDVINVTNLNANNITTGTINGQRIGTGSLSLDKLSEDVYTEAEVDDKLSTMQAEIDGAIETWTGTDVPTLNNAPASGWTTDAIKDTHVGDVYFVVNSQSQQNGYNYRFTKSGSTYSWQLIKDNDVTNALQRLTIAEGKITTFDSDISTLKTDTGTLTTKTESLETRMSDAEEDILDKVDTTTFNEVSNTVDQHTQTITQHTTAISNKADNSTVTAVTNRVSKNEQDISGINTTIGSLQTTVESKADGSTVTTISDKLNQTADTVDGHTSQLTSVTAKMNTVANPNLSPFYDRADDDLTYWTSAGQGYYSSELGKIGTQLEDGWAHFVMDNSARTSNAYVNFHQLVDSNLKRSTAHTFLIELRNLTFPSGSTIRVQPITSNQSSARYDQFVTQDPMYVDVTEDGSYYIAATTHADYSSCNRMTDGYFYVAAGVSCEFDIRISLYEGEYSGPYKPYVDQALRTNLTSLKTDYATYKQTTTENVSSIGTRLATAEGKISTAESSITQNAQNIELKVSKNDVINQINVSTEGATISASKVNIEGAAIFSSGRLSQTSLNNAYDAKGAAATAESNAKANAVKRTQRIWYRKSASGAPSTPGTASSNWVTKADDGNDAWTKMHVAISSTHKYIYTCEQYEMANGTVGYTSVLLDNTITVIDGGNIITGSVTANKLNASDINASNSLTIGALSTATQDDILNSKVVVGGRNLLAYSGTGKNWGYSTFADGVYTRSTTGTAEVFISGKTIVPLELGETYTFSAWMKTNGQVSSVEMFLYDGNVKTIRSNNFGAITTEWKFYTWTVTMPTTLVSGSSETAAWNARFDNNGSKTSGTEAILYVKQPKLERGNKATDWTPAPEDVDASVEAAAKTATNYISVDSTGIRIADSNPATATTYQHQTATNTEFVVNNESMGEFSGNGVRIGKSGEYHTIVADKRFGIEYDTDRLFDINADGTTVNIYAGGSTKATGVKYTNAYVEGMLAWFKSGCTISNGGVLDPDGNATVYTAVLQSGSSTQYSILDGDGDEFESAAYGGVYYTTTTPVLSDRWNLDTYLTPMQEVPSAPTSIEMGGSVVRFSDGKTTLVTSGVAEGDGCTARGNQAHAEGQHARASGRASHAEGYWTSATGSDSHAEGTSCSATGQSSHAEGSHCTASGDESHASGFVSEARNARSFAHGTGVISSGIDQVVFGTLNVVDSTKAFIIGNGYGNEDEPEDSSARSNAFTVDWDGRVQGHMLGDPTDGDRYGTASQSSSVSVATGTGTAICSHEFGPGVYVIVGHVQFASNATGYRACAFSTTSGSVPDSSYGSMQASTNALNGRQTHLSVSLIWSVSSTSTLYLNALHNRGSALNAFGQMRWVRLL